MHSKLLFSKKEAAQALSVSLRFLDGLIGRKELRTRRLGRRVLIEGRELDRFARTDHVFPKEQMDTERVPFIPMNGASELPQDEEREGTEG